MLDERRRTRGPLVLATIGVIAAALVAAYALGRAGAPSTRGATRDGVPVGYANVQAGAVDAAMMAGTVYARAQLVDGGERRALLGAIGEAGWVERADARIAQLDLAPLSAGTAQRYVVAAVGAKLISYSKRRAVVRGWFFQALGGSGRLRPVASLTTQDIALDWSGDWRVAAIEDAPEQAVPEMRQRPSSTAAVARLMDGLDAPSYGRP